MASIKVPESVRRAAKRGLEMRREAPKSQKGGITNKEASRQGIGSGIQRARNLMSGSVSEATIPRMVSFFARHGQNIKKARSNPSEHRRMRIADLIWGGAAGERWANSQWNRIQRERNKKKK
ncbi:MAG: hypothetical protein ACO24D_14225 [bacterium]